jgi:sialic acid synthase SpsE/mannose-6-phosphate isomerase-like protein (cupin superfamily)
MTAVAGKDRTKSKIPDWLFIFEMANNHMGDVEHGIRIVKEFAAVAKDFDFKFAFKLQYRHLDTFIHPDYRGRMDIKYIKRFQETRITDEQKCRLVDAIRENGFIPICTAFDEISVDQVVQDGFQILKVASCSLTDWPLLEKAVASPLPMILSTAGAEASEIDNVVSFLKHRGKDFALMHCIAEYPTPSAKQQMNQIDYLQSRYQGVRVGFSTHEPPGQQLPVAMAIAKGSRIFEKHVGVATDKYALNGYSSTPEQVRAWLQTATDARAFSGIEGERIRATEGERASLASLRRGVFVSRDVAAGEKLPGDSVFMAIPTQEGQVTANDWSKYINRYATAPIKKGDAVLASNSRAVDIRAKIYSIVQQVKAFLKEANIVYPGEANLEISHHYGIEKFEEFGIVMITVVNREYCKKLIVVFPGQNHPEQYHNHKEETFHILYGKLQIKLDGVEQECGPGTVLTVERGVRHAFTTKTGAVFEEISSTHFTDDSYYTDPKIAQNKDRKTFLTYWMW